MTFARTEAFKRDYRSLEADIQKRADSALERMAQNPRHPSLHAHKMQGHPRIWEARVSRNYRITFEWERDHVVLRRVGTHDILRAP